MTATTMPAFAMEITTSSAPEVRPPATAPARAAVGSGGSSAPAGATLIDIDRVNFFYGASQALHGINLQIEEKK